MKASLVILFIACTAAAFSQQSQMRPVMARVDSLSPPPLPIAIRYLGAGVIAAGDSLTVSVDLLLDTDIILLGYVGGTGPAPEYDPHPHYCQYSANLITIYGVAGRTVFWVLMR